MSDTVKRLDEIESRLKAADANWHIRVCGEDVAEGYDSNCSFLENAPADVRYLLSLARAGVELAEASKKMEATMVLKHCDEIPEVEAWYAARDAFRAAEQEPA